MLGRVQLPALQCAGVCALQFASIGAIRPAPRAGCSRCRAELEKVPFAEFDLGQGSARTINVGVSLSSESHESCEEIIHRAVHLLS